ncbi:MAG: hypothetical protein ABI759_26310 [Candidatus Solibacter sp.]
MTILKLAACSLFFTLAAMAQGVAGKWTAAIDTQIGVQNYTYDFKVDGEKLTGTAKSDMSGSPITEGAVKGNTITFSEMLTFQDMTIKVTYTGTISGDEIKFNRKVGDLASEDFVAKRAK